jgi:hypothetical protein
MAGGSKCARFGTTTCVILGVLAAVGCSSSTTSSGPGSSSGGTSGGNGDGGAASNNVVNVTEVEPNNGPDMAGAQDLGTLNDSETLVITGQLSSGGWDGTKYTGDWDLFTFDAAAAGSLDVKVDWTSGADVDVALYDAKLAQVAGDGSQAKPAAFKAPSVSGKMLVALYSKDLAAPYTLTIAYTKAAAATGGTCPTTPIVAANHTGGCNIDDTTPVCAVADLRNGGSFELDWTTNQTFCEGPHTVQISGDPPSNANSVTFKITSDYTGSDAQMTRNIGGFMKITAKDIATLTSASGIYYYGVGSFYGSTTEGRAFQVLK